MDQQPPPPTDTPEWYYLLGQEKIGPLSMQAMRAMIQNGTINSSTLVWRQGLQNWVPAGGLPEFAYAAQNTGGISLNISGDKKEFALGLNTGGFVLFIVLLFLCLPLCWLPWVIESTRANR
jgi:hypothetical protein